MKLVIQIPCYNEEKTLPETINSLPKKIEGISEIEILIINDGSTDRTVEVAKSLGVQNILNLQYNMGLAEAFSQGLRYAYNLGADLVVNTDADNQYCADDIEKLIRPILEGKAQMVIGDRQTMTVPHFSFFKKRMQRLGSRLLSLMAGVDVPDATSGFRAFSRELCHRIFLFTKFSYTLETIIMCGKRGIPITSVPVRTNAPTRPSRLFRSMPHYLVKSGLSMVQIYLFYTSVQILAKTGLVFIILGLLPGIRFLILFLFYSPKGHVQSLILAAIMLIIGSLLLLAALIISNVTDNRKMLEEIVLELRREK